jgi:hypothetical protein
MTKTFKELSGYMAYIANSAGGCHPEWKEGKAGEYMFEARKDVKKHLSTNQTALNFKKLGDIEKTMLGFAKWDEKGHWLIPVWLFNILPNETKLYDPISEEYETKSDETNDDYRLGCVAWSFDFTHVK